MKCYICRILSFTVVGFLLKHSGSCRKCYTWKTWCFTKVCCGLFAFDSVTKCYTWRTWCFAKMHSYGNFAKALWTSSWSATHIEELKCSFVETLLKHSGFCHEVYTCRTLCFAKLQSLWSISLKCPGLSQLWRLCWKHSTHADFGALLYCTAVEINAEVLWVLLHKVLNM